MQLHPRHAVQAEPQQISRTVDPAFADRVTQGEQPRCDVLDPVDDLDAASEAAQRPDQRALALGNHRG